MDSHQTARVHVDVLVVALVFVLLIEPPVCVCVGVCVRVRA